jgi:hypothetical protein
VKRWRAGGPRETPDSNGIRRCFVLERGRVATANDNRIMVAGIAAANTA